MSFKFEGVNCPVCGEAFKDGDDVVVCPDCGWPHHRACYKQHGGCAYEAQHTEGFEYIAPQAKQAQAPVRDQYLICERCGTANDLDAESCTNCGLDLTSHAHGAGDDERQDIPQPQQIVTQIFGAQQEPMSGNIDGVPVRDLVEYIGPSAQYYIFQFRQMEMHSFRRAFCFSSFAFTFMYFLYRKMWAIGFALLLLSAALSAPSVLLTLNLAGYMPVFPFGLTEALLTSASNAALFLNLGLRFLLGIAGFRAYRKHAVRAVKNIKAKSTDEQDFRKKLHGAQGPSRVVFYACMFLNMLYMFTIIYTL